MNKYHLYFFFFFFQAEDGIRDVAVTGVQTCALPIYPTPLSMAPFTPAFMDQLNVQASEVGLDIHPHGYIQTLPALGAYVGADIVAGVLATGVVREDTLRVFVDVGTNGEIVLGSAQRALATAAPAGPAFEGSQIKCGMRATVGAIEGVQLGDL